MVFAVYAPRGPAKSRPPSLATLAAFASGDCTLDRIQIFRPDHSHLTQFGSRGAGRGQFYGYMHVATNAASDVFVSDYANGRIQRFDTNGTLQSVIDTTGASPLVSVA